MNALLVNGSPKPSGSSSGLLLDTVAARLGPGVQARSIRAIAAGRAVEADLEAEALVLAFPLYVDGLPAPLLEWLVSYRELAEARPVRDGRPPAAVYAICQCGFYEAVQTESALGVARNFARRSGLSWGSGLGVGGGGMIEALASVPPEASIKRPVTEGLSWLAGLVARTETPGEERYVQFAFPRFAYILSAHAGWRRMARARGLRPRDIGRRLA